VAGAPYGGGDIRPLREHLRNLATDPGSAIGFAVGFGSKRFLARHRRAPGFFAYNRQNTYPLQYHGEHLPQFSSRVWLSSELDATGMPKLNIDVKFSSEDVSGGLRAHQFLDEYLQRSNLGRIDYLSEDSEQTVWKRLGAGFHQLGTTRMSNRVEDGVVDKDLAVHGVSNVYVLSSSSFPSSGQANSTFLIVAFAVRLADRLRRILRG